MPKKDQPDKEDYQSEVLDIQRKVLKGVVLKDINWPDKLKGQDRVDFLRFCSETVSNQFFDQIFSCLYFPQVMYAANMAENYDVVSFNRATANGISLAKEFFQKYARQFEIEFGNKPETESPHAAFESVTEENFLK